MSEREPSERMPLYNGQGYVELCYSGGTEEDIIRAARMSTSKGFQGWDYDFRLLKYLYDNKHTTPFEFVSVTFEICAPIFVARQVFRHRTFSYNEESGRYTELNTGAYFPELRLQDTKNRQGSLNALDPEKELTQELITDIKNLHWHAQTVYKRLLSEGVAKEVARVVLPVATMTHWRMTGNLHNWLHFLRLRLESHAQKETADLALAIFEMMFQRYPRTTTLFLASLDKAKYPIIAGFFGELPPTLLTRVE